MIYLTKTDESNNIKGTIVWEAKETLSAAGNGNTILLPDSAGKTNSWIVALIISSGNGKVQHTVSNRSDVTGGSADWIDWDAGAATSTTTDVFFNVSAVRAVNTSGTVKLEVRVV